jgi:hypothetical protein
MSEKRRSISTSEDELSEVDARRKFLRNCAKFAAGTPPAVALLLSASRQSRADDDDECVGSNFDPEECYDDDDN